MNTQNKVICVDDSFRPSDIPINNWIKKNEIYTVKRLMKTTLTNDYYFELEEISPNSPPYMGYNIKRFRPIENIEIQKIVQEMTNS